MVMIPITGGAYKHASQDVNCQRCVNIFPTEIGPEGLGIDDPMNAPNMEGIGKGALIRSPGLKLLVDLNGLETRGLFTIRNEYVYAVVDNKIWQLVLNDVSKTVTSYSLIGTIGTSTGTVHMRNNNNQLIIVDGSPSAYIYMANTYGTVLMGPIGGSAGDTYTLEINGALIYNNQNVSTALTAAQVIAKINLLSSTTGGLTASSGGTGVVNLTGVGTTTITVSESGTGFVAGTDGLTVTGYSFASGSVASFQTITSPNYTGGSTVVYNDGYFLYNQVGTNYVWQSNLGDGTNFNALAYFTAETKPCILQGLAVNKGEIWLFGDTLIEVWYDAANAPPGAAYSYRVGSGMDIGCQAPHSIVEMDLINIWLDSRGFVCQSDISPYIRNNNSGYDMRILSTPAMHAEFATYPTLKDAIGTYYIDRGHIMYMLSFPSAGKTWVYDFPTKPMRMGGQPGEWHERTYLNPNSNQEEYYLIQYVTSFYQMNIAAGTRNGKIYLMSSDYFTDDGADIKWTRTTAPFSKDMRLTEVNQLKLRMETGSTPQVSGNPPYSVNLRISNDGAHTWSEPVSRSIGGVGNYYEKIIWNRLGTAEEWVFEFSGVTPMEFSIIKASALVTSVEQD